MAEQYANYTQQNSSGRRPFVISAIIFITVILSIVSIFFAFQFRGQEPTTEDPDDTPTGQSCTVGSECPACDYPLVAFCSHPQGSTCNNNEGTCECRGVPQSDPVCGGAVCNDLKNIPMCDLQTCESVGLVECGNSLENGGTPPAGCGTNPTVFSCETRCTDCNNPTRINRYCRQPDTTPPPPNNKICGQTCDANNVCSDGTTCTNGVCANPSCPTDSDCTCDATTPPICGETCSDTNPCSDGTVCNDSGVCVNPTCPEEGDCTCTITPDDATCFEACDEDTPCLDGTVCSEDGICVNPNCSEDSDCSCNPTPEEPPMCGEVCTPGGEECTDGMSCIDGVCRNPSCEDSPNCVCQTPSTAIFDDSSNTFLILGLIFITLGLLAITQKEMMNKGYVFVGQNNILRSSVRNQKVKDDFEKRVSEEIE